MTRRQLLRRVTGVDHIGGERWRSRPEPVALRFDRLTADECEGAARVRASLDEFGLSGVSDEDLDFMICLHERLTGEREMPCSGMVDR